MSRLRKQLGTALLLLAVGGGLGAYVLWRHVPTHEQQRQESEAKRLYHFGRDHVSSGVLITKTATIHFERTPKYNGQESKEPKAWKITHPVQWPADTQAIESMLDHMAILRAESIITETAKTSELQEFGLWPAHTRLSVATERGDFELHVGHYNRLVDQYPITDAHKKIIAMVDSSFMNTIDRPLAEFRNAQPLALDADEIQVLEITAVGIPSRRLGKTDNRWLIDARPADTERVERLLSALTTRLRVSHYVTDNYNPLQAKDWGITQIPYRLQLQTNTQHMNVQLMQSTHFTANDWLMYIEGTTALLQLPDWFAEEVKILRTDLRDHLISRIEPAAIAAIEFYTGPERIAHVVKDSAQVWRMADRPDGIKQWLINDILNVFRYLRSFAIYRDEKKPTELAKAWLSPASQEIRLFDQAGQLVGSVQLGRMITAEQRLVTSAYTSYVHLVSAKIFEILPQKTTDLFVDNTR